VTTHFMLDLETWGTTPGSDIRSIGVTCFDPTTGHVGTLETGAAFYTATYDSPPGLHRDPNTVEWWNQQSAEARAAFDHPVPLKQALLDLNAWMSDIEPDPSSVRLWAHGPQFDVSIIEAAYRVCQLPVPWHYRSPRDVRTALDVAGVVDHSALLAECSSDERVAHHALDDAIVQARAVCNAVLRLDFQIGTRQFPPARN